MMARIGMQAGFAVAALASLAVLCCFLTKDSARGTFDWWCGRCARDCLAIYSDDANQARRKQLEQSAKQRRDAAQDAMSRRRSVWAIGTSASFLSRGGSSAAGAEGGEPSEFVRQLRAQTEAEVVELRAELEGQLERTQALQRANAQAEAKRQALQAESQHVADEAAGTIEAVLLESGTWAEQAKLRAPEMGAHIDFMVNTMHACGQEALEPKATSHTRSRASEMAAICSAAMVNYSEGRARMAEHRVQELTRSVQAAERAQRNATSELMVVGGTPAVGGTPGGGDGGGGVDDVGGGDAGETVAAQVAQARAEAEEQLSALREAEEAIRRVLAAGALTRSPLGRYARRLVPSEDGTGALSGAQCGDGAPRSAGTPAASGGGGGGGGGSRALRYGTPSRLGSGSAYSALSQQSPPSATDSGGEQSPRDEARQQAPSAEVAKASKGRPGSKEQRGRRAAQGGITPCSGGSGAYASPRKIRDEEWGEALLLSGGGRPRPASGPRRAAAHHGGARARARVDPAVTPIDPGVNPIDPGVTPGRVRRIELARAQRSARGDTSPHEGPRCSPPSRSPHPCKSSPPYASRRRDAHTTANGRAAANPFSKSSTAALEASTATALAAALAPADMELVFDGQLGTCCYEYNDLLIRVPDADGRGLSAIHPSSPPSRQYPRQGAPAVSAGGLSWLAVLAADRPLFLQLDGVPSSLSALVMPDRRLRVYGAAGAAFAACHLGGDRPMESLADRPELSTHRIYCEGEVTAEASEEAAAAAPGQEVLRHVRVLAPRSSRAMAAARGGVDEVGELCV